ncbi:MAG: hypothetical protein QM691_02670 [Opitutaceae bacterium]
MPTCRLLVATLALVLIASAAVRTSAAEWTDAQGVTFRGEPAEIFGPFALFHAPNNGGRRVLLSLLTAADQVRFATALTAAGSRRPGAPLRSGDVIAADLAQGALRIENGKLVPAKIGERPAPDVLVVFYGAGHNGESWFMHANFLPSYFRLRAVYGERFETLFFGVRTDANAHREFAVANAMPWLVADFRAQPQMTTIAAQAPAEGIRAVAFSSSGVPLVASPIGSLPEIRRFVDELTDLLFLHDPANPRCWPERLKYFDTVRPALHAHDSAPPLLIGSPLRNDLLRRKGVAVVAAQIEVGVDGRATAVTLARDCDVPDPLRTAIIDGLRRGAVFSPAIDGGKPVAGSYAFRHEVPPAPACSAADLAWVDGEARVAIPLDHWLLLRPIHVPEQSFSSVESVDANGVNVLTPFEVSDEKIAPTQQRNSFDGDWFEIDGADSIHPVAGATQVVEGRELTWDPVNARDGFVDMRASLGSCDFSIGYAWTEIESDSDKQAWLGIGSDDGLKIWLNGELVHSRWIRRNSKLDDEIVPLRLRAGRNRLLVKIQNRTIDWSFVARLRTR